MFGSLCTPPNKIVGCRDENVGLRFTPPNLQENGEGIVQETGFVFNIALYQRIAIEHQNGRSLLTN